MQRGVWDETNQQIATFFSPSLSQLWPQIATFWWHISSSELFLQLMTAALSGCERAGWWTGTASKGFVKQESQSLTGFMLRPCFYLYCILPFSRCCQMQLGLGVVFWWSSCWYRKFRSLLVCIHSLRLSTPPATLRRWNYRALLMGEISGSLANSRAALLLGEGDAGRECARNFRTCFLVEKANYTWV